MLNNKKLLEAQAKKWIKIVGENAARPEMNELDSIRKDMEKLDQEEEKYAILYATDDLSLEVFKSISEKLKQKRKLLALKQSQLPKENKKKAKTDISEENLISTVKNIVANLDFSDKNVIIKQTVTQVVANKNSAILKGRLPVNKEIMGLSYETRYRRPPQCRQINFIQRLG